MYHPYVAVFDIDNTLMPSLSRGRTLSSEQKAHLRSIVSAYKQRGYGIGINTARVWIAPYVKKFLKDIYIDVDALPAGAVQRGSINSHRKVKALKKIQDVYGVQPHQVIYYDDNKKYVQRARENQYVALHVEKEHPFPFYLF
jgi:hydroxymethylpyrimidine pyrophosphatase-like HAD family hydrolase